MQKTIPALAMLTAIVAGPARAQSLVYQGDCGPGQGKHIVWLAGDHEYRSEETMPALARVLAKHHGFKCTVLFTINPETGFIDPTADNLPGTAALQSADLMCIFLRFKNLPAPQMQPIAEYLDRGGPVIGLRTSTHAFKIPRDSEFACFDYRYDGEDYELGFGRQILGETWAGHYGTNHKMSTRLEILTEALEHPILRGVEKMWIQTSGYWTKPKEGSRILAVAQPLQGMTPDSPPVADKPPCPGAWVRTYVTAEGRQGRVFTTTYGASQDILNDGFRRMLVNACFWACGLQGEITASLKSELVGPYSPSDFGFDGYRSNIKPLDLCGWESAILPIRE